ncbi:restriction endonuclease [Mangrovibacter phragmitis]|uniref:Restriction endonuclease n=1 Tax=Mangrovibacter phragmitis TaxID=1691903 RepID=A0A1B7L5J5_9ENTR|nr:restriction endonuclease subunit S [Mangrovibacter phragmitis]OAT77593.1 restriction endonuclease [Mangrovibacter phragmitis]
MNKQKKGLVPELRFPEFEKEPNWPCVRLNAVAKRSTSKNKGEKITRVLTNSAVDGVVDQRDYFDKDIAVKGNLESYYIVDKGDYVYNPRISSTAPVGPISKNKVGKGVMSPLYTVFRFNSKNNDFFEQFFKSSKWYAYLQTVSNSGARHDRMSITGSDFMAMPVPNPCELEQQKIADCLASIDKLITLHTQKLEALKDHKKGLMQQLFPAEGEVSPKLRFPEFRGQDKWRETPLSSKVELISGLHLPPDGYAEVGEVPYFTGPSDYTNNIDSVSKWTTRSANIGRRGDTVITVKGSGVGELLRLELNEVALGRQLMAIRSTSTHEGFVFHFLATKRQLLIALASGNLIPGLSRGDILSLGILVPESYREQQMVSNSLSSIDEMIAFQEREVDSLKQHKKGLIQKLFPVVDEVM